MRRDEKRVGICKIKGKGERKAYRPSHNGTVSVHACFPLNLRLYIASQTKTVATVSVDIPFRSCVSKDLCH